MGFAPEAPTTETLHAMHPLSNEGRQKVYEKRKQTADALKFGRTLLAIVGPCAMTGDEEGILGENSRIAEFADRNKMVILHRLPPWKPRTNADGWFGLETTDPVKAHQITVAIAEQNGNLAMEFGHTTHIERYIAQAALGWRGSRNDEKGELLNELIHSEETLPLAIKNGMNGSTQGTIVEARRASQLRKTSDHTPVSMIFRGGVDFQTPPEWIGEYTNAFMISDGRFIVDVAHGSEQAHDPNKKFGKSTIGQLACLHAVNCIAEATTWIPRGVMIEASNLPSPTDPVVPLDAAFEALERLAFAHRRS